ncbi:cytochrome P450 4C1-like [Chrysoperla carnea]|uniref:cytochrome P450 4C1-like n=1 Tax=Chrysoperla carnea TaxID=189513 RepID=UPI001D092E1B|nr:cytochrome P450 4C1-like [Chrysoperla carnea]
MFLILITVFLVLFLLYDISFRLRYKEITKLSKTLPGPRCLPLISNAQALIEGPVGFIKAFTKWQTLYGNLYRCWASYKFYVFACRPEDVEEILNNCVEKDYHFKFVDYCIGEGILISPATKWKYFRKIIQPSFHTKVLNQFCHTMALHAQTLNKKFQKYDGSEYFDCYNSFFACTLDTLFETNFGEKMNFQNDCNSKFIECSRGLLTNIVLWMGKFWLHPYFIFKFSSIRKTLDDYKQIIIATTKRIIQERSTEMKDSQNYSKGNQVQKPFLENLILAKENGHNVSDYNIECEVNLLALAGSDSTATVMCYALMCLGVEQSIQDKVFKELYNIFGDSDRECTLEDVKMMSYLEMVIKETMRIFAPAPLLTRSITQHVKLESVTLPPGTNCVIGVLQMHRSQEIYPNPLKFDPERFTPEEIAKRHPSSFIPFGGGPRNCVARKYAYLSMKIILSTVLRKYRVYSDVDLGKVDLKMEIFLKPVNGYRIRLKSRNND